MSTGAEENEGYFLYMGVGGGAVPRDITHLRIHSTVTAIPAEACRGCYNLQVVELPEGLLEIGASAFSACVSLATINFPSTLTVIAARAFACCLSLQVVELPEELREIGESAFYNCESLAKISFPSTLKVISSSAFSGCAKLVDIELPEGLREIGRYAFCGCKFTCLRIPPLVSKVDHGTIDFCKIMCSLEVPRSLEQLILGNVHASFPKSLRNVAIPEKCDRNNVFPWSWKGDLSEVFPSSRGKSVTKALKHRFNGLPIHERCYYKSYQPTEIVLADLEREISQQSRKKCYRRILCKMCRNFNTFTSGEKKDCLGMTPLHILACSTRHDLRLYQLLIERYPENLITRDKWGDIPLLYAFWSNAPREILQLLIESLTGLFPNYVVDWIGMVETLSRAGVPLFCIDALLETQRATSPNEEIWQDVLVEWAKVDARNAWPSIRVFPYTTFRHILKFDISTRLDSLGVERWQEEIETDVEKLLSSYGSRSSSDVYSKLVSYEHLKEATSLLELALWKAKMEYSPNACREEDGSCSTYRDQCRINSGAEIVVPNVRHFLFNN